MARLRARSARNLATQEKSNKADEVYTIKESRLTKQDEKLRLRRRLQDQAVDLAAKNRWDEAAETNRQDQCEYDERSHSASTRR